MKWESEKGRGEGIKTSMRLEKVDRGEED